MMRAMLLEFPDDPSCDQLDRQYILGGSLLVAPVLSEAGWVAYYLPAGAWTHLLTGEVRSGGHWCREQHGFSACALGPAGTVLPSARATTGRIMILPTASLRVYELEDQRRRPAPCRP